MYASIVWDGTTLTPPADMGEPRADQLRGSNLDNLSELAGRICYDSCGTGRNSVDYHQHIRDVGHTSVLEHANLTFAVQLDVPNYLAVCESLLNRPGIWAAKEVPSLILTPGTGGGFILRITANLRAVREWHEFPPSNKMAKLVGDQIQFLAKKEAPLVLADTNGQDVGMPMRVVPPKYEEEIWISLFLTNVSRGLSHEIVRHKFRTAISQRSTRYVDEGDSEWCWHPLIKNMIGDEVLFETGDFNDALGTKFTLKDIQGLCQQGYKSIVDKLQAKLAADGIDKFTARKQARGAARGLLGNALLTELIFSASLAEWKWIFGLRAAAPADAEIRVVMNEVYELLTAKFPDAFVGWTREECPDKIGYGVKKPD